MTARGLLCGLAMLAPFGVAQAEPVAPSAVVFDESGAIATPLADEPGDPVEGKVVMSSRGLGNCVACHTLSALSDVPWHGEVGPSLDGVGSRRSIEELRGIVADAKKTFEGSVMPSFYKNSGYIRPGDAFTGKAAQGELDPLLTAQQIEDVVAFLTTLKE